MFGDKGYISKALAEELWDKGVQLVTKLRRKMKPVVRGDFDKMLLRKRSLIETIHDQLNNISQLEHSRHRSLTGLMLNLVAALVACSCQPNQPSLNLSILKLWSLSVMTTVFIPLNTLYKGVDYLELGLVDIYHQIPFVNGELTSN